MKIAIPADGPHLDARVGNRLGTAPYLLVVDTETMEIEAAETPCRAGGPGTGVQVVSMALAMGAAVLVAGYVAPHIAQTLEKSDIRIVTGVEGSVRDAVQGVRGAAREAAKNDGSDSGIHVPAERGAPWKEALGRAIRQLLGMLPVLTGVILLVGLFQAFMPAHVWNSLFSGNAALDTLLGSCVGSLLAGNPVNSYVIGDMLLRTGVGLCAVTALMMSWVCVGLVHLPAEAAALGMRFAVARNAAALVLTLLLAPLVAWLSGGVW